MLSTKKSVTETECMLSGKLRDASHQYNLITTLTCYCFQLEHFARNKIWKL